jgi:hypothetical protein
MLIKISLLLIPLIGQLAVRTQETPLKTKDFGERNYDAWHKWLPNEAGYTSFRKESINPPA